MGEPRWELGGEVLLGSSTDDDGGATASIVIVSSVGARSRLKPFEQLPKKLQNPLSTAVPSDVWFDVHRCGSLD